MTVRSFTDYRHHIRRITLNLKPVSALRFCNWCIERFQRQFGETVWDGLTSDERLALAAIISELRASEALEQLVPGDRAAAFMKQIESFGPLDEVAAIEVEPDATGFREIVWSTLEYCRSQDVVQVCAVSEEMINSVDHHATDGTYQLENMFTAPPLANELAAQTEFIQQLQA